MAAYAGHIFVKAKQIPLSLRFHSKQLIKVAAFSTEAAHDIQDSFSHFRTAENNPTLHTQIHAGKFYTLPQDIKNKLFFTGGIPKELDTQMKTFQEACVMVREPAVEIISFLKKINYSNPAVRFVIYGRNGTGKTCTLIHLLHYGHASKFLLLHVPWVSNWTKRPKEVVASQYNEKRIDLPIESALWLQHFKMQNTEVMEELDIRISKSYTWSKREVSEEGSPLMDVVDHGIQRVRHSSDCVAVLLKEIKLHAQANRYKVMVVVDGVNAFWNKTNVRRTDKSLVPAGDITIVHAFKKVLQNDWNNAVVITSVDILPYNRHVTMQEPYTPYVLLGKEGFELLCPFVPISTGNYSDKEVHSVLDYYCDRLWIQSERGRGEDGRKQIKFLSGYNPREVMKLCDPL